MSSDVISVLVLENSLDNARAFQSELDRDRLSTFTTTVACTLHAGLDLLAQNGFDLAVLSLELPDGKGNAALAALRTRMPGMPILACSDDEERAFAAVQAGADDYIVRSGGAFKLAGRIIRHIVECRRAKREVHHFERRYNTLAETLTIGLCRWLPDTTLIYANEGYRTIFGIQGEAMGRQWLDFVPEKTREQTAAVYRELAANPRVMSYDHPVTVADGTIRQYRWFDMPVFDETGALREFQSVGIDLTESQIAREKLSESEERANAMLSAMPDIMFRMDREGVFLDFRANNHRLYVGPESTIVGARSREILPTAFADMVEMYISRTLESRQIQTFEYQLPIPDQGTRDFEARMVASGEDEVIVVVRDITDRRQAEESLRLAEHRYRRLYEHAPVMYIITRIQEGQAVIADCNELFLTTLGYTAGEVIGQELGRFYAPDSRAILQQGYPRALQGVIGPEERDLIASDGRVVPTLFTAVPILDGGGNAIGTQASYIDITERRRALAELNESNHRFTQMADNIQEVFWMFDNVEQRLVYLNPAYETIWGRTAESTYQDTRQYIEAIHPDDRPIMFAALERQARGEQTAMEYRIVRTDGSIRWIHDRSFPILNETGAVIRTTGIAADITERKQVELALRLSEEKYRGLVESLDSTVATVDADGRFLYLNDLAAAYFGGTPAELIGRALPELVSEPLATDQLNRLRKVITEDRSLTYELEWPLHGEARWHRTTLQPIHDEQEQVVHVLIHATDIHELKMAQQSLLDLNRTLEARVQERTAEVTDLYDNAPNGYHSLDVDGNLVMVNQTEAAWLGYSVQEMLHRPYREFVDASGRAAFETTFARFKQAGSIRDVEINLSHKDGSLLPVLISSTAIYDETGRYLMSRSTVFDNTERKKAADALRIANAEMERALRLKDEFLANMSHELRTPLGSILALSEILLEEIHGPLSEIQRRSLGNIDTSGRHLLTLINDLLDLSKIEAGRLELDLMPVAVDEICQASLVFVKQLAIKKQIRLSFSNEYSQAMVQADPKRLKQMLINLLSNAVKFTPERGKVDLSVTVHPDQKMIQFAVRDTGIGIAPDDMQRLFQPFSQLDSTLSRQYEGTGLGLALVKRLTTQHGGYVDVESSGIPGEGSTFIITLPYTVAKPHTAQEYESLTAGQRAGATGSRAGYHVLLVEDNELNIDVIGGYLTHLGFQLSIARTGPEALEFASARHPDLILMDIQLPVMNGLEVTRRLRKDPRLATTPIIALTALAMTHDRDRCLQAGATEYLSKPVRLTELTALMDSLLN